MLKKSQKEVEEFVRSLLSKMTLTEKVGQMYQVNEVTAFDDVRNGRVGSALNVQTVKRVRTMQEIATQSRLKIPLIFGLDVIHGFATENI